MYWPEAKVYTPRTHIHTHTHTRTRMHTHACTVGQIRLSQFDCCVTPHVHADKADRGCDPVTAHHLLSEPVLQPTKHTPKQPSSPQPALTGALDWDLRDVARLPSIALQVHAPPACQVCICSLPCNWQGQNQLCCPKVKAARSSASRSLITYAQLYWQFVGRQLPMLSLYEIQPT